MVVLGVSVFLLTLSDFMHRPDNRVLRTLMFVVFGVSSMVPLLQLLYLE